MDKEIIKKTKLYQNPAVVVSALIAITVLYFAFVPSSGRSVQQDINRLMIAPVEQGAFEDTLSIRGRFESASTVFLDAVVGGRVEEVFVEDGTFIEKGQPLLRLSNARMQIDVLANEARISEQLNNVRSQELSLEQNRIKHVREIIEIEYNITINKRTISRVKPLISQEVIAARELEDAQDNLHYYQQLKTIALESQTSDVKMQENQLVQLRGSTKQLEDGLMFARQNFENLKVTAPVSGKLTAFNVQLGQSFKQGDSLGRIDDPDNFKVTSFVDEFYLSRIYIGQLASAKIDGKSYTFKVKKTYPNIINGQFKVDLVFDDKSPEKLRSGQNVQMKLTLGDTEQVKRIANGSYYRDTGGSWIFVVDSNNEKAIRRAVKLGRRNNDYIEVLDGLELGENVVVSPYTNYLDAKTILLK
jgi:HlyD family secretion protein